LRTGSTERWKEGDFQAWGSGYTELSASESDDEMMGGVFFHALDRLERCDMGKRREGVSAISVRTVLCLVSAQCPTTRRMCDQTIAYFTTSWNTDI
jgi:hypothetical protein